MLLVLGICALFAPLSHGNCELTFWHLTDFHWDPFYRVGGDPQNMCHGFIGDNGAGVFGDYLCDSPWSLVVSTIDFMREESARLSAQTGCVVPSFILWTGDDLPHVASSLISKTTVLEAIQNITTLLVDSFPDTQVWPILGNHDFYPKGQASANATWLYQTVADMWAMWLPPKIRASFAQTGFYTTSLLPNVELVALNTVLWYTQDLLTSHDEDPEAQFQWLENTLSAAASSQKSVVLMSHVPPGMFERSAFTSWFYPNFNARYLALLQKFSHIIVGHFSAHQHSDTIRLIYGEDNTPLQVMYLAPSVTPWKTTLPNVTANNPGLRLFWADPDSYQVEDYWQYYLNLKEANIALETNWSVLYQAKQAYLLSDFSAGSWNNVVQAMAPDCQVVSSDTLMFNQYLQFNGVDFPGAFRACDSTCRRGQLCSIQYVDYTEYNGCMQSSDSCPVHATVLADSTSGKRTTIIVVATVVPVGICVLGIVWALRRRRLSPTAVALTDDYVKM